MPANRALLLLALASPAAHGQQAAPPGSSATSASLSGTVTDPTGALIPGATVSLEVPGQPSRTTTADSAARFTFANLPAGAYRLTVTYPGFASKSVPSLSLADRQHRSLTIALPLETQQQEISVGPDGAPLDPNHNADATVLKGSGLNILSDDPTVLNQQLQGLGGGSGDSPQIYVDGFSGGKLPPKSQIREIRINQNPYSAEYDAQGNNRIEVFTKPGTGELHGDAFALGTGSGLSSRNPYSPLPQPFYQFIFFGDLSGPITKKLSYSSSYQQLKFGSNAIVNATVLDPDLNQVGFTDSVPSPTDTLSFSTRIDAQVSKNNTLTARYQLNRTSQSNAGVGQFALASQGFDSRTTVNTLQISDTQIFGPKVVNDFHFQYLRTRAFQGPVSDVPALVVQGAFTGGGNNLGRFNDNQDAYELQDYVSVDRGKHFLRAGIRQRFNRDANRSTANYNGEYIFSTLTAYQLTEQGLANGLTPAQIRASGGGASQFNITSGDPAATILVADTGLFAEDDWKARKNLTLSLGLRFESQTAIPDHADLAPRIGFAYGIHGSDKKPAVYTLRGGFGLFYSRLPAADILTSVRQNGVSQQQFVLTSPDTYPSIPPTGDLASATPPTIFRIASSYTSPYLVQSGLTLERSLGKYGSISAGYTNIRGIHLLLTRNANAPLPGTYNPADPTSGVRPLGGTGNVYEYSSMGLSRRDQINVHAQISNGDKFFLFSDYRYRRYRTDTNGGFPSNQYDIGQDYGRAANDAHNRFLFGMFGELPYIHLRGGPFLLVESGSPFNITLGNDLNGDSQFNDRPTFATDLSRPSVIQTAFGNFDTSPIAGQRIIPIYYGNGPGLVQLFVNLSRSIHFGPEVKPPKDAPPPPPPKPGEKPTPPQRRFSMEFGVNASNVLNHVNPAPPVGVLGSSLFGKSNALNGGFSDGSANRTINFVGSFQF